jgi:hypothetical protein
MKLPKKADGVPLDKLLDAARSKDAPKWRRLGCVQDCDPELNVTYGFKLGCGRNEAYFIKEGKHFLVIYRHSGLFKKSTFGIGFFPETDDYNPNTGEKIGTVPDILSPVAHYCSKEEEVWGPVIELIEEIRRFTELDIKEKQIEKEEETISRANEALDKIIGI